MGWLGWCHGEGRKGEEGVVFDGISHQTGCGKVNVLL